MSWNPFEHAHTQIQRLQLHYAGIVGCIDKLLLTPWLNRCSLLMQDDDIVYLSNITQRNGSVTLRLGMHVHLCIVSAVQHQSKKKENQIKRRAKEKKHSTKGIQNEKKSFNTKKE